MNNDYVLTNLGKAPEYYKETIKLIEDSFQYNSTQHFDEDFKNLLDPSNHQHCLILIHKPTNVVAAHLAFTKNEMNKDKSSLPVVFIGGIATNKEHRGKNLFRFLINYAIEENKHAALFALWSEITGLYEKFGFTQAGGLLETGKNIINSNNIPNGFYKTGFNLISEGEFNEIKKLYYEEVFKKFFTIKRTELNWSIIRSRTSCDLYIKKENGKIISYFVLGKGKDLQNIIHEFASEQPATINDINSFKLWLPEYYSGNYPNHQLFYTAFMKIGNVERLSQFLSQTILHFGEVRKEKNELTFIFEGKEFNCTEEEFIRYIIGPYPLEEFKSYKLSPYISGLDSI